MQCEVGQLYAVFSSINCYTHACFCLYYQVGKSDDALLLPHCIISGSGQLLFSCFSVVLTTVELMLAWPLIGSIISHSETDIQMI